MAVRLGGVWNNYRGLHTTRGVFRSFYHPGAPDEWVTIIGPGDERTNVPTPSLVDWFLTAEKGFIVVNYAKLDGNDKVEQRATTKVPCGDYVFANTPAPTPTNDNAAVVAQIRALLDRLV